MRPLDVLSDDELNAYYRASRPMKRAWVIVRAILLRHSKNRINRLAFILGWVSCERYYRERLEKQQQTMQAGIKKVMETAITDVSHLTGIYDLD